LTSPRNLVKVRLSAVSVVYADKAESSEAYFVCLGYKG
jgi:hypothetical protein